jgi:DegV family protein with EDD domain
MINILTDSTADLSEALRKQYHIEAIPMYIHLNGSVYKDGEDIDPQMLFDLVEKTGIYPTTSAPSPGDFIKFLDRKEPTIYIGLSSKLSATYGNAQLALSQLNSENIDLIDALSISTGYGQTVLQAAMWRDEGISYSELKSRIRQHVASTGGVFILDTLEYLYRGGRCSALDHFVASLLRIHPFLEMCRDGTLGVLRKVNGSRRRALRTLLDYFLGKIQKDTIEKIFITHLDCDEEEQFLKNEIQTVAPKIEIASAKVGCVLATHSGPKPIGIAYCEAR